MSTTWLWLPLVAALLLAPAASAVAINPVYQQTQSDVTWTDEGGGVYSAPVSAEAFTNEIWERPVEDGEWTDDGTTRITTGEYYGYGDLKEASFGVGTSMGADYLFVQWEVVGGFFHEVGNAKDFGSGLLGHYYFYFEPTGGSSTAIEIDQGKLLGADFGDVTDEVKYYIEDNDDDVPGPGGIAVDGEGGDSHGASTVAGEARKNTVTSIVEAAILLSDLGLIIADFANLDYAYAGVATSNPFDPNTDLFANDFYTSATGLGVEYDTLKFNIVPEPSTFAYLGLGVVGLCTHRRRRRRTVAAMKS